MIFRDKFLYEKNNFVKMLKNVDRYRSENNFVESSKQLYKKFKQCCRKV